MDQDPRAQYDEAARLAAALPGPARKPRTGRLFAEITNHAGQTFRYRLTPLPHQEGILRAYRLALLAADGRELARHVCQLQEDGAARCGCTGPYAVECEHLAFLRAAGLMEFDLLTCLWDAVCTAEIHERDLAEQVRLVTERQVQLPAVASVGKPPKPRQRKSRKQAAA